MAALVAPAAMVGLALAAYNQVRFGDSLEFGLRYQFAAIDMRNFKLFGPEFFAPSVAADLVLPARYSIYYPFLGLREETFGLLTWAPASLLALVAAGLAWRARRTEHGPVWIVVAFDSVAGVAMLASLLFYSYQVERYQLVFLRPLMVAVWIVVLVRWHLATKLARIFVGAACAWTIFHSVAYTLPAADGSRLARALNHVPAAGERLAGWSYGPLELDVILPDCPVGSQQPVFATGSGRDAVFLQRSGPATFRLGFAHRGFPGVYGDAFTA